MRLLASFNCVSRTASANWRALISGRYRGYTYTDYRCYKYLNVELPSFYLKVEQSVFQLTETEKYILKQIMNMTHERAGLQVLLLSLYLAFSPDPGSNRTPSPSSLPIPSPAPQPPSLP